MFVRGNDASAELYVVGADGKGLRRLTRNHALETANDYVTNADGSGMRQLTHERRGTVSHHPSWSTDGKSIVFMSNRGGNPNRGASLWIMSASTSGMRRLTTSVFEDVDPDW